MLLDLEKILFKNNLVLKNVIHVGGHIGAEIQLYKKINKDCAVEIFEPCFNTFKKLQHTAANYTNVNCYNVALGSVETNLPLYTETSNNGQSNSLLKPKLHTIQYPSIVFNDVVNVEVKTLDSFNFDANFNFLNIDVQGFELEVLKGGQKTLQNIEYIICEVNNAELYENCPRVENIDAFLEQFNFKRTETDWLGGTWGDAFYIKK